MFGIGLPELVIILIVALVVFGPRKLPDLAKSLGRGIAEFRKASDDFKSSIESDLRVDLEKDEPATSPPTPEAESATPGLAESPAPSSPAPDALPPGEEIPPQDPVSAADPSSTSPSTPADPLPPPEGPSPAPKEPTRNV